MAPEIKLKDSSKTSKWLDAALEFERKKYASNPIQRDIVVEFNYAQAWGFIVAGYFLLELSLKALSHRCNCEIKRNHALYKLFKRLPDEQKSILRLHYTDFVNTFPKLAQETPNEIDQFFKSLDGDHSRGSFDWRYYLIEEPSEDQLPFVDINLIHEVVYSIYLVHRAIGNKSDKPEKRTYSFRLHDERASILSRWYEYRKHFPDWVGIGDRIEKLWGPDYDERYSYVVTKERTHHFCFGVISDDLAKKFPIHDMRMEFQSFQANFDGPTNGNANPRF